MNDECAKKSQPLQPLADDQQLQPAQREMLQAALALLLGPETSYYVRLRATRRLGRQDRPLLPLLLTTLSSYPEITTPSWPWWPPQYEHCGRLLVHLSKKCMLRLDELLHHPAIEQPGPVLWTSVIEAAGLLPYEDYEELLCQGLETPWATVRYAAAMALAMRARKVALQRTTLLLLQQHIQEHEAAPVRLTASYALLSSSDTHGLKVLMQFVEPQTPEEIRKAAIFILATELPITFTRSQRSYLSRHLLAALYDQNTEMSLHAAHALSRIALPSILHALHEILRMGDAALQTIVLTVLEELAQQRRMRQKMRERGLLSAIAGLLHTPDAPLRRQVCYTLAACGGEFVMAALGLAVIENQHPAHREAIEALRLLRGALRPPQRGMLIRWLQRAVYAPQEEIQVTALDSLVYLLWQAQTTNNRRAWQEISRELLEGPALMQILYAESAWVRQRTVELLGMMGEQLAKLPPFHERLLHLLRHDTDSGVRACVAFVCGAIDARWAIPELIQSLLDTDEYVAETALNALDQLATGKDSIILYLLREIACYGHQEVQLSDQLVVAARVHDKKRQQRQRREAKRRLRTPP